MGVRYQKEKKTVIKRVLFAIFAVIELFGLALVAGAQGPRLQGGGGLHGPGRLGGPGGWGTAACAQKQNCPQFVFKFTRTSVQPVLLATGPDKVTKTTTGMIAGDNYGSRYRDVTVSAWGSQSGPQEFIYVRDMDPGIMMNYIENVTKGTYVQFPIKPRTPSDSENPNPNWKGERTER